MASIKISGLTEQTTADDTDLLPVASSAGLAKRMTLANFVTWLASKLNSKFAPVGYGLGEPIGLIGTTESNLHDVVENFLSTRAQAEKTYFVTFGVEGAYFIYGTLTVGYDKNHCVLKGCPYSSPSMICQIVKESGVWYPLEWINPPMQPGIEYRTTERWNGYTVYTKLIEIGTLPNNSSKYVYDVIPIGAYVTSFDGTGRHTDGTIMPICTLVHEVFATRDYGYVGVNTVSDLSSYAAYITVKYIKP